MDNTENKNAKSSKYSHLQKQKVQYEGKDAWQENVEKFEKGHMRHSMVEVTTFQEKYPEYMGAIIIKKEFTEIKNILKVSNCPLKFYQCNYYFLKILFYLIVCTTQSVQ